MSELLSVDEAATRLRISAGQLNRLRSQGTAGPPFVRLGVAVRYRPEDLGSGLIDHSQNITVAAMQMADMKV